MAKSVKAKGERPRASGRGEKPGAKPAEALADDVPEVGPMLRLLREQRGLSLEKLAQAAGVSRAMLGQVELGQSVPTIRTLWRVAKALGVPFSALLGTPTATSVRVLRAVDSRVLSSHDGSFRSRALFPFGAPRRVEFYELKLAPGCHEKAEPHAPGTLENLCVARGRVLLEVGGAPYELQAGDAIEFEADGPHAYRNPGNTEAVLFLVMAYAAPVA